MDTSKSQTEQNTEVERFMRPASQVMQLARLGSAHQTRLSFMRALLRRFKRENWTFDKLEWEVDANGEGHAVYCARGPRHTYSLVHLLMICLRINDQTE